MKKYFSIIILFLLLIFKVTNANQPDENQQKDDNTDIFLEYGTQDHLFYIQNKQTEEEERSKLDEVKDRKQNLIIQSELHKISEKNLQAADDASIAARFAAGSGIAVAIIALFQLFMFYRQLKLMGKTNNNAEMASKAALLQAQAMMNAERAYVKMLHQKPGFKLIDDDSSVVNVEVKNLGRTPAQVTDAIIDFKFLDYGEPLPIPYPFRPIKRESFPNGFLMPDESIHFNRHVSTKQAMATGKQLWVFGYVDYIDVFNQRWRGGYARKYVDQKDDNLVYNYEARDNFDRERSPEEGRDWDQESIDLYNLRKNKGAVDKNKNPNLSL